MKLHVLMMIGLILALMTLKPMLCRAQAEVAPDHYNATGIDPGTLSGNVVEANREAKDFHGTFTLPFDVRYAGITLSAGTYFFSIHTLGKREALALITKGDATQVQARMKVQSRRGALNALLVEHKGQKRTLKAISLKNPGIMLYLQAEPRNLAENTEFVPISYTTPNGVAN